MLPYAFIIISAILSIACGTYFLTSVLMIKTDVKKMVLVKDGTKAAITGFFKAQFDIKVVIGLIFSILLYLIFDQSWKASLCFIIGGMMSAMIGKATTFTSIEGGLRTAEAARTFGLKHAFRVALKSAAFNGLLCMGLPILIIEVLRFFIGAGPRYTLSSIVSGNYDILSLCLGMAFNHFFSLIPGGIYASSADIGSDLIGKIEAGIPEDDIRNPLTLINNSRTFIDNTLKPVTDLILSFVVCIYLIPIFNAGGLEQTTTSPLIIAAVSILATMITVLCIKPKKQQQLDSWFHKAIIMTAIFSMLGVVIANYLLNKQQTFEDSWPSIVGYGLGALLCLFAAHTSSPRSKSVRDVVSAAATGHATTVLEGIRVALKYACIPALLIGGTIMIHHHADETRYAVITGCMIAAFSSMTGIIITLSSYSTICDNAGAIIEQSGRPAKVRKITDTLDNQDNQLSSITYLYLATCAILIIWLIQHFVPHIYGDIYRITHQPQIFLIIMLLTPIIIFLFSNSILSSISSIAFKAVEEGREYFKKMQQEKISHQDTSGSFEISLRLSRKVLYQSLFPAFLLTGAILIFYSYESFYFLLNLAAIAFLIQLVLIVAGGAWISAKKTIESDNKKDTDAHKATVTGDTIAKPLFTAVAPALNLFTVSIMLAVLILAFKIG